MFFLRFPLHLKFHSVSITTAVKISETFFSLHLSYLWEAGYQVIVTKKMRSTDV